MGHHEINQFCSKHTLNEVAITLFDQIDEKLAEALKLDCAIHAPGIEIIGVRVTKPDVPSHIKSEFEKREAAVAALRVAEQQSIEAKRDADVAAINSQMQVAQQKAEQEKEAIKDAMHLAHEKALADAEAYKTEKRAAANKLLLTPEYLELRKYENIAANAKIYFGEKIPTAIGSSLETIKRWR